TRRSYHKSWNLEDESVGGDADLLHQIEQAVDVERLVDTARADALEEVVGLGGVGAAAHEDHPVDERGVRLRDPTVQIHPRPPRHHQVTQNQVVAAVLLEQGFGG